jgi:hypothetical protein
VRPLSRQRSHPHGLEAEDMATRTDSALYATATLQDRTQAWQARHAIMLLVAVEAFPHPTWDRLRARFMAAYERAVAHVTPPPESCHQLVLGTHLALQMAPSPRAILDAFDCASDICDTEPDSALPLCGLWRRRVASTIDPPRWITAVNANSLTTADYGWLDVVCCTYAGLVGAALRASYPGDIRDLTRPGVADVRESDGSTYPIVGALQPGGGPSTTAIAYARGTCGAVCHCACPCWRIMSRERSLCRM